MSKYPNKNPLREQGANVGYCKPIQAKSKPYIKVQKACGRIIVATGREAQTLWHLLFVHGKGATSLDFTKAGWARRTSAYVFDLRKMGVQIQTILEVTDDGARVARYGLAEKLVLKEARGLGGTIGGAS